MREARDEAGRRELAPALGDVARRLGAIDEQLPPPPLPVCPAENWHGVDGVGKRACVDHDMRL